MSWTLTRFVDKSESSKTCAWKCTSAQGNLHVPLEDINVPFLAVSRCKGLVVVVIGVLAGMSALRMAVSVQPLSSMAEVCGVAGYGGEVVNTGTILSVPLLSCSVLQFVLVVLIPVFLHGPTPPRHF